MCNQMIVSSKMFFNNFGGDGDGIDDGFFLNSWNFSPFGPFYSVANKTSLQYVILTSQWLQIVTNAL